MKEIFLTKGMVALVDDEDYERLSKFIWHSAKGGHTYYAVHSLTGGGSIQMHREILGLKKGDRKTGDHKDRNGLHNWRDNLRVVTKSLNRYNSKKRTDNKSGYNGVNYHSQGKKWRARIGKGNKRCSLGLFRNPILAAMAYDRAAIEIYGSNAILNFPDRRIE